MKTGKSALWKASLALPEAHLKHCAPSCLGSPCWAHSDFSEHTDLSFQACSRPGSSLSLLLLATSSQSPTTRAGLCSPAQLPQQSWVLPVGPCARPATPPAGVSPTPSLRGWASARADNTPPWGQFQNLQVTGRTVNSAAAAG